MFNFVFLAKPTAPRNCTLRPYIVTSASLNSSNQTTIVSNQMAQNTGGGSGGSSTNDRELNYHPHMEYLRQNDKGRDKKSNLEENSKKVKRTTTISLLEISSMKHHVSNNNITLKSEKYERKKRDGANNSRPSSITTAPDSTLSSSLTTSQSTIQENYQYLPSSSSTSAHIEMNSNLNSQSISIQQDNQNNNNNNNLSDNKGHSHRRQQHIRVRKSLLNSNNKQRKINHYINLNSHPSSTSQTQSSTATSSSSSSSAAAYSSSSPNYAYLKFDNLYNNINENFNHLENYDNIVYSTMELECLAGYDGGLPQQFYLEAYDSKTKKLRLNITSIFNDVPLFRIDLAGNAGNTMIFWIRVFHFILGGFIHGFTGKIFELFCFTVYQKVVHYEGYQNLSVFLNTIMFGNNTI